MRGARVKSLNRILSYCVESGQVKIPKDFKGAPEALNRSLQRDLRAAYMRGSKNQILNEIKQFKLTNQG